MAYLATIYQFFAENWDQVREATELAVALWVIVAGLAPELADRLRQKREAALVKMKLRKEA